MVKQTTSISNGKVEYQVDPGGSITIMSTSSAFGFTTGISFGNTDSVIAIQEYVQNARNIKIPFNEQAIARNNNEITSLNKLLSSKTALENPDHPSVINAKNKIASLQESNAKYQATIDSTNAAIASVQSEGNSIIASLQARQEAEQAAKKTATPAPTPTAETTAPAPPPANTKPALAGAASDDSGATQPKPAGSSPGPVTSPAAAAGAGGTTPSTAKSTANGTSAKTGVTQQGANTPSNSNTGKETANNASSSGYKYQASRISTKKSVVSNPGKRLYNPLGEFSSYTYQITLYMVTPDAYEAFVQNGRKKINILNSATGGPETTGAYIVAQSGGVSSAERRAPSFNYDYGIDNLKIKHSLPGKATMKELVISEIEFQIIEPYGFSFISNLRRASDAIIEHQKKLGSGGPENPSRQFFVLGVRFYGYDANGNVMEPSSKLIDKSGILDPSKDSDGIFEFFIDINISDMKFKIDGKSIVYSITAARTSEGAGFSKSKGFIQKDKTVEANTVGMALDQLMVKLNEEQNNLAKGDPSTVEYPNQYEIVWLPGTEDIRNASLISPARLEKYRWQSSGVKTSEQSNVSKEVNQQEANENIKTFTFKGGKSIPDAITEIMKQSSYIEDALKVIYTSDIESNSDTKANPNQKPPYQKKKLSWYTCTPQISEINWDKKVKNWAYKISYQIGKYDTPVVDTPLVANGLMYPGPHKRYEYWYTGENRDIISYEQTMNQTYNSVVLDGAGVTLAPATDQAANSGTQTPVQTNTQTPQPKLGSTGYGLEAQNSFLTALLEPDAYAEASITILGDPDYLIKDTTFSENEVYDQYYNSETYTINPSGGQVFIEIDFKEAVDYNNDTGTLKINESILFWKYPDNIAPNIRGISYQVLEITSTFYNGSFKQQISATINDMGTNKAQEEYDKAASERASSNTAPTTNASGGTSAPLPGDNKSSSINTSGTPKDKPVTATTPAASPKPASSTTSAPTAQPTVPTKNGPVANDDAVSTQQQFMDAMKNQKPGEGRGPLVGPAGRT